MEHPIHAELLAKLTVKARETWYGFLQEQGAYFNGASLLNVPENRGFNSCLVVLLRYCDRHKGSPKIHLRTEVRLVETTLDAPKRYSQSRVEYEKEGVAAIVLTQVGGLPPDGEELARAQRIWTKLVLHELGHILLHWREFEKRAREGRTHQPRATAQEEAEAWVFGMTIFMLALAEGAYQDRRKDEGDQEYPEEG